MQIESRLSLSLSIDIRSLGTGLSYAVETRSRRLRVTANETIYDTYFHSYLDV